MQYTCAARVAVLGVAMAGSLLAAGCGGGSNAPDAASVTADATTARSMGYTVLPDELVTNGLFASGLTNWTIVDAVLVPFNGTSLNRSKWFTRFIYAGETLDRLNDEKQRYRDNDNHIVANGVLNLVARKVSSTDPDGINYESGMIRSDWTSLYGYYEARVKMPGGLGVWPAFWLNSDVGSDGRLGWPPEIDIFEFVNNGVDDKLNMLHSNVVNQTGLTSTLSYSDAAFNTNWSDYVAPFNFNEGWHTIGAQWDADNVTVFVDGLRIYTRSYKWNYNDGTLAGPAHILLNFAIGGSWAGRYGIDDSAFPQALQIDWVRAYRRSY